MSAPPRPRLKTGGALVVVAILVVALNLRPAVVAIAPLLDTIRADTGISSTVGGLLTTLPVLCFGAFAPLAPAAARRYGLERTVLAALAALIGGIALRLVPGLAPLFAGTVVAGAAIAVVNVLIPAFVKRDFARPGPVTGLYVGALNVGAAAASGLTVPFLHATGAGWRPALAIWALLAVVGLGAWFPLGHRRSELPDLPTTRLSGTALLRDPLARRVVLFLGLNSVEFYAFAAWFPTILESHGRSDDAGGALLALSAAGGTAGAILLPLAARRLADQRPLVVAVVVGYVIGLAGLVVAPSSGAIAWALIFGLAQGSGFALGLLLLVLRSPDPELAGALSGIAQTVGYLIAAAGPFVLGAVHDATESWGPAVAVLLVVVAPLAWAGWGAGRDALVADPRGR